MFVLNESLDPGWAPVGSLFGATDASAAILVLTSPAARYKRRVTVRDSKLRG